MPDWAKEIRAAIAALNLGPMQEAELVEELSQHLRDRYDEMLAAGTDPKAAYESLLQELNDGALVSGLKASLRAAHPPVPLGKIRRYAPARGAAAAVAAIFEIPCWFPIERDAQWFAGLRRPVLKSSLAIPARLDSPAAVQPPCELGRRMA